MAAPATCTSTLTKSLARVRGSRRLADELQEVWDADVAARHEQQGAARAAELAKG